MKSLKRNAKDLIHDSWIFGRDLQASGQGAQWEVEAVVWWCPVPSPGLCSHLVRVLRIGRLGRCSAVLLWLLFAVSVSFSGFSVQLLSLNADLCSIPAPPAWALRHSRLSLEPMGIVKYQTTKPLWGGVSLSFGSSVAVSEFWDIFLSVWYWQQCRVVRRCHGKRLDKEHVFLGVLVHSASPGNSLCQLEISCK